MAKAKDDMVRPGERDKETVHELLKLRQQNEERAGDEGHHFQEALQQEFHKVWDETIKPALEQLKGTTQELLERFTDFEDDFRGYLKRKEPDVDVELLEEIFGDKLREKKPDKTKDEKPGSNDLT